MLLFQAHYPVICSVTLALKLHKGTISLARSDSWFQQIQPPSINTSHEIARAGFVLPHQFSQVYHSLYGAASGQ
jgi:hypothetical protein